MRSLYSAASGMAAQQLRLDNVANNLANVNTTGFKKSRQAFQDLFYQELTKGGASTGGSEMQVGSGVRTAAINRDHTGGTATPTGNRLDVAIEGDGFFVLETAEGDEVYTRDGSFTQNGDGVLTSHGGLKISGDITIPIGATNITILEDGTLAANLDGDPSPTVLGQLSLSVFANPSGMTALGGNVFAPSVASGDALPLEAGSSKIMQGFLESSNVDVAEELVEMILAQRAFELNSKAVQAADETLQVAVNLRR